MTDGENALAFAIPVDPLERYRSTYNKSKQSGVESQEAGTSQGGLDAIQVDEDEDMEEEEDYVRMSINAQKQAQQARENEEAEAEAEALAGSQDPTTDQLALASGLSATAIHATAAIAQPPSPPPTPVHSSTKILRDGTVDRDEAFLQIAGKARKGAKEIDEFDKDFNALKITKSKKNIPTPGFSRTGLMPIDYDALVADFDTDTTGNFIRVEKRDLIRKDKKDVGHQALNPDWAGRPNFKKFKKVSWG